MKTLSMKLTLVYAALFILASLTFSSCFLSRKQKQTSKSATDSTYYSEIERIRYQMQFEAWRKHQSTIDTGGVLISFNPDSISSLSYDTATKAFHVKGNIREIRYSRKRAASSSDSAIIHIQDTAKEKETRKGEVKKEEKKTEVQKEKKGASWVSILVYFIIAALGIVLILLFYPKIVFRNL